MTIGRICQRNVDTARIDESVKAAAQRMGSRVVGTLVVLDDDHVPIGILTDRDLAVRVVGQGRDPNETLVGEVMTERVQTAFEGLPVAEALALMRTHSIRRLPVVGSGGRLLGLVSLDDVLGLLAEELHDLERLLAREGPRSLAEAT